MQNYSINIFIKIFLFFNLILHLDAIDNTSKPIKLALVGPLSGKHTASGMDMKRAILLRISEENAKGGINGRKIELLTFDDKNEKPLATQRAKEAVASEALAVIGHRWASTSGKGIAVYKEAGMTAISGTATSTTLTQGNDWFFRAVPSNAQESQTLAYYLKYILKKDEVTIIYDSDAFGVNLYEEFEKVANQIDLKVVARYKVNRKSKTLDEDSRFVIESIKKSSQKGGIFFATHDKQTVPLVYYIKEYDIKMPLIGSSAIAKVSFAKSFDKYPIEQGNKGYYTNNIYCAISMLFDIGGNIANQFKHRFKTYFKDDFKKDPKLTVNSANAAYYNIIGN